MMAGTGRRLAPLALLLLAGLCTLHRADAQGLLRPGGFSFSDEVIYDNWRVQKNEVGGWYRLVDPEDNRVTRGSFETCMAALDKAKVDNKLPPLPQDVVIVLHGLGAPRSFMNGISDYLAKQGGYYVIN